MLELGTIVQTLSNISSSRLTLRFQGEIGVIIGKSKSALDMYLIQFEKDLNGHAGNNQGFEGKPGHCWFVSGGDFTVIGEATGEVYRKIKQDQVIAKIKKLDANFKRRQELKNAKVSDVKVFRNEWVNEYTNGAPRPSPRRIVSTTIYSSSL